MDVNNIQKINDLSKSPIKRRFDQKELVPETMFSVAMGRVSTKRQKGAAHSSDESQLQFITDYVEEKKLLLVRKPWDIAETASDHDKRKNFLEMIEFIEDSQKTSQPIKHVIFSHPSRAARNRKSIRILEELMDLGVWIHFARENMIIHSKADLGTYLKWVVDNVKNEDFIDEHRRNVWEGMLARVERGLSPCKAPFGYRNHRPTQDAESIFIIEPNESKYMIKAFQEFSTGRYSEKSLKRELDNQFPTLDKTPDSRRFSELLRNPFYYGDFLFGGNLYKGNPQVHPSLISYGLWKKVQDVLNQPKRSKRKKTATELPYIGMIRCGGRILDASGRETNELCGCSITGEEKRKPLKDGTVKPLYYWHCTSIRPCSQRNTAYMKKLKLRVSYSQKRVEELLEDVFKPLNFTADVCKWMQNILLREHEEKSAEHKKHVAALRARESMLQVWINQAYRDKLKNEISEEFWRQRNDELCTELEAVRMQIKSLDDDKQEYIQKGVEVIELVQHFETIYKNGTPEKKRRLVEIVSSNHVLRNGTLEFDYRKPFDILVDSGGSVKWWS